MDDQRGSLLESRLINLRVNLRGSRQVNLPDYPLDVPLASLRDALVDNLHLSRQGSPAVNRRGSQLHSLSAVLVDSLPASHHHNLLDNR